MKSQLFKFFSVFTCFAVANLSVPYGALATLGRPIADALVLASKAQKQRTPVSSRLLTDKESASSFGRTGECPYTAGGAKWDVNVKGVNVDNENFSTSVTDMSFDGGFGIPVNITRSYSANDASEGPFGKGWELSADVRNTAGGLLKSGRAPVMSIPNTFKERHTSESDPNIATQPAAAVVATDASGKAETIQKDVDGVLTTPSWDHNVQNNVNAWVYKMGAYWQVLQSNTVTTVDGTTYQYQAEGSYPAGTVPWNAAHITPAPTPQYANVLKVASVTDRQGNITTYTYGGSYVTFNKVDGVTSEHPLTMVTMPNGHVINITWGDGVGSDPPTNRIWKVGDGIRTVVYGYTNGLLTSVTTPGGKTTTYGYGSAGAGSYWTSDVATNLLTTITDPRGLTTTMLYCMGQPAVLPYNVQVPESVCCYTVNEPNGRSTFFGNANVQTPGGAFVVGAAPWFTTGATGTNPSTGGLWISVSQTSPQVTINMQTDFETSGQWQNVATWSKTYDAFSENLLTEVDYDHNRGPAYQGQIGRLLPYPTTWGVQTVTTVTTYNFMGNPLIKAVTEHQDGTNPPPDRTYNIGYAYWDKTKYYQQKATQDQAGRYTYTDFNPSSASAGSRGQQLEVYDPKNCTFYLNTGITPPAGTPTNEYWRYQLQPVDASKYSASFAYDSVGRCTDVYKLQSTVGSYSYVHTQTSYGANGSPSWGQASQVIEDQGTGHINRITTTNAYTAWGKACDVTDAAGHEFVTSYDPDGLVQSVTQTDHSQNLTIASYVYGTTANTISFGQVLSVTDGLSGAIDSMTYQPTGGGTGQVSQVAESGGPNPSYTVAYAYDNYGNRKQTTYTTTYPAPGATRSWLYHDYYPVGNPEALSFAFETLTLLDGSNNPTAEEMQYSYDSSGRIQCAAFAQSPASGFAPSPGQEWYDSTHLASTRAIAEYSYDAGGRMASVYHYWETYSGGAYSDEAVLGNSCAYETTGLNRALKVQNQFWKNTGPGAMSQS